MKGHVGSVTGSLVPVALGIYAVALVTAVLAMAVLSAGQAGDSGGRPARGIPRAIGAVIRRPCPLPLTSRF
ncbi:hypothetical protein GCM10029978_008620 [Actinoallomurus acanthiterrae]